MKILCDVHLPYRLVNFFKSKGIEAIHANHILKKWNTEDSDLSHYADENNFILITKDSDFRDSFFLRKTPKKLVRVTLGNVSNNDLIKLFEEHFDLLNENYTKDFFYIELNKESVVIVLFE